MTKVIFETATIADALKKAEQCAPRKSDSNFGSNGGIVIEVRPESAEGQQIRVRSNNEEIFYTEWVDCVEIEGGVANWRVSAQVLSQIVGSMPLRSGARVALFDEGGLLRLEAVRPDRTKGKISLIPMEGYPMWGEYQEQDTAVVKDLGERISQVSWASADAENVNLSGVFFTGTHLVATDRFVCAMVPCEIPVVGESGVNVSAKDLGRIIKHSGDVRVGVEHNWLNVSPDAHTQIRCRVYDIGYPDTSVFDKAKFDSVVYLDKDQVLDVYKRISPVAKGMDVPMVKLMIGGGELNLRMDGAISEESIQDCIPIPGQADHFPVLMKFLPRIFLEGFGRSPDARIALHYNSEAGKLNAFVHVDGGGGYRSWFVQAGRKRNDGTPK